MVVFITGATGLLGCNVVTELLARDFQVRALVRRPDAREILGESVDLIEGDLRNVMSFEKHLVDTDVLIHAAACYGEYYRSGDHSALTEINVQGTNDLLYAAARQGVRTIIFISSSAVLKTQTDGRVDENSPYAEKTDDPYFSSKIDAEQAVFRFMESHPEIRIVSILPTVMLGPGDRGPTPTGSFIMKLMQGKMKFVLPGWHRIADARDVATAVVASMTRGESGERYLVGGRRYAFSEIYGAVAEVSGQALPTRKIPPAMLLFASHLMGLFGKLTRKPQLIKPGIVKRLQEDFVYRSTKAEQELGVSFRPLAETMEDTVKWFLENEPKWREE